MRCFKCGGDTLVVYTKPDEGMTRRKRICQTCGQVIWTTEIPDGRGVWTANAYQKEALRTAEGMTNGDKAVMRLLNGVMGLNGEAGECIDLVKKHLFQGHPLDRKHLASELGDVLWYVAVAANGIGYSLEEIMKVNVTKLRRRYPNGFEAERSKNRGEGDE